MMNSASEKKLPAGDYPDWFNIRPFKRPEYTKTLELINKQDLNTVCISGNCPNRYECFSCGTATFMVLGDICTRNCRYCNIKSGQPKAVDPLEPERIGEAVKKLKLKYAVLTQVTRDDLPDGGAGHLAETIKAIRSLSPDSKIEILISDLGGNFLSLKKALSARPDVLNHNIETVPRLFPALRPQGNYLRSLAIIKKVKNIDKSIASKSGLMLGLGETKDEITNTMKDLRRFGCDIITLGQYLQPSPDHAELKKYYTPDEYAELKLEAENLGFKKVFSGPMVRSSYRAGEL
jgi:lipoyl synthase